MKKTIIIFFSLMCFIFSGLLLSQSFTLITPNGGESWNIGDTYDITWNSNQIPGNIILKLKKGNTLLGSIAWNIPNTGTYSWTINDIQSTPIEPGNDYKVIVRSKDDISIEDISDANFIINSVPTGCSIEITEPSSGDTWYKGNTYNIQWTKSGTMDTQVEITLYKADLTTLQTIIKGTTENDGLYSWKIPNSIPDGVYVVRVKTIDNTVFDDSGDFYIYESGQPVPSIRIIKPNGGENWKISRVHKIRWVSSNIPNNEKVKIQVYKGGENRSNRLGYIMEIPMGTVNSGSYSWVINDAYCPSCGLSKIDIEPGDDYKIQMFYRRQGHFAVDFSDNFFSIVGCGINVFKPKYSDLWENEDVDILWDDSFDPGGYVSINYARVNCSGASSSGQSFLLPISQSTDNDGAFTWTTPDVQSDTCYRITIKKLNTACMGKSAIFKVKALPNAHWWNFKLVQRPILRIQVGPNPYILNIKEFLKKLRQNSPGSNSGPCEIILTRNSKIVKHVGKIGSKGNIKGINSNGIIRFKLVQKGNLFKEKIKVYDKGNYKLVIKDTRSGKILRSIPVIVHRNTK